ncbi:MAG: extracellular solute-binding protein [Spirochaetaceae bacterium]|nr:extracellular solute-binding protein [Spirochaetaceae bacterium]
MRNPIRTYLLSLLFVIAPLASSAQELRDEEPMITTPPSTLIAQEPLTISVATLPDEPLAIFAAGPAAEWLEEQTGITVKWDMLPQMEAGHAVNLMLASGATLPDLLLGSQVIDSKHAFLEGSQGYLVPLNDFIDHYSEKLKPLLREYPLLSKVISSPDGQIYSIANYHHTCTDCTDIYTWYNYRWLDELKFDVPQTPQDLYQAMKAFKEQDLNHNGLLDEVPYTSATHGRDAVFTPYFMNAFEHDDGRDRLYVDAGKVTPAFTSDAWREGLRFMRKLHVEGLIDPNAFTQSQRELMLGMGRSSIRYGLVTAELPAALAGVDIAVDDYRALPPIPRRANIKHDYVYPAHQPRNTRVAITRDAKNPEASFRWADYVFSIEAHIATAFNVGETPASADLPIWLHSVPDQSDSGPALGLTRLWGRSSAGAVAAYPVPVRKLTSC